MSKHTPGPWEWVGSNRLYGGPRGFDEILAASDDGKPYGMHSALIEHHWDQEQAKANARLIAAAPDLLEALMECVEDSEAAVGQYIQAYGEAYRPKRLAAMRETVRKARAAIAKATGEQP